jgi:hypothetical protein
MFSEPLDFAWTGTLVGLLFAALSSIALWRKRALHLALFSPGKPRSKEPGDSQGTNGDIVAFGLKQAMDRVLDRHLDVLNAVYNFLRVQEALRGLDRFASLLRRRLAEMELEIRAGQDILDFLETQLNYYKDHFRSWDKDAFAADFAPPRLDLGLHVTEWLMESLKSVGQEHLCGDRGSIDITDERFPSQPDRGSFESQFLRNAARLVLSKAERKP